MRQEDHEWKGQYILTYQNPTRNGTLFSADNAHPGNFFELDFFVTFVSFAVRNCALE
jgi:hypothetical protein